MRSADPLVCNRLFFATQSPGGLHPHSAHAFFHSHASRVSCGGSAVRLPRDRGSFGLHLFEAALKRKPAFAGNSQVPFDILQERRHSPNGLKVRLRNRRQFLAGNSRALGKARKHLNGFSLTRIRPSEAHFVGHGYKEVHDPFEQRSVSLQYVRQDLRGAYIVQHEQHGFCVGHVCNGLFVAQAFRQELAVRPEVSALVGGSQSF